VTLENINANPYNREKLTEDVLKEWQNMLNEAAELFGVPAGLITRVDGKEIEILLSSETEGNPYPVEYTAQYPNSGWYCEHTLKSKGLNLIPNALQDSQWKDNSAVVELHMVSYLGMPIGRPDGGQFGTVCFIDNKQNAHNALHVGMVKQIKRMIELSLRIVLAKEQIGRRDRLLDDLSKIYPICSYCKKVREESGEWIAVEKYVHDISGATASHGMCPVCSDELYGKEDWYIEMKNEKGIK
jgi:transcriptional regulator with GAF, ATPase, and Fis domain